jgi:hypothetical protein
MIIFKSIAESAGNRQLWEMYGFFAALRMTLRKVMDSGLHRNDNSRGLGVIKAEMEIATSLRSSQ